MGLWKIVVPEATTNMVLNPSGETTGNFVAEAGTAVTRVTTYAKYGLYSYRVQTNTDNEGLELTLSALANAAHYVTMMVYGTLPAAWDWSLDDTNWTAPTKLEDIDAEWALYGASFPAGQANGSTKLSIHQDGAGSGDFYIDGVQVEEKDGYYTTYVDGDRDEGEWNGAVHASTSDRSAEDRGGGRVYDFADDFNCYATLHTGSGMSPVTLHRQPYALQPGSQYTNTRIHDRSIILTLEAIGSSLSNLHTVREELLSAIKPDLVKDTQSFRLRYTGATVQKEIRCRYEGGLEKNALVGFSEVIALRLWAEDPFWVEVGESAAVLTAGTTSTTCAIIARIDDEWELFGGVAGPSGAVHAICKTSDNYVYAGGDFTNVTDANGDYITRWNGSAWSSLGITPLTAEVWDIVEGPDGTVYIAGEFTNAGGDVNADYICQWDGSSFSAVGTGADGIIRCLAFDSAGNLYAGGDFGNIGGVAAVRIAYWDGSSWNAMGSGAAGGGDVYSLAVDAADNVYAAGDFLNMGGVAAADRVAMWDGSAWSALSVGAAGDVDGLAIDNRNHLYAVGSFTNMDSIADADYVAVWNGSAWAAVGIPSTAANMYAANIDGSGNLYIAGAFSNVGGKTVDTVAKWNGNDWLRLPVDPPSTLAWEVKNYSRNDVYIGWHNGGTASVPDSTVVTNAGTATAYPVLKIRRSGGTSAILILIENATGDWAVDVDSYALLDGETLTLDFRQKKKTVTSSMFGNKLKVVNPTSDFAQFGLLPGDNTVQIFMITAGAPTITATMLWSDSFWSVDDDGT